MNRLSGESSPYLLQHAHNPVDWFPWGEEALQKAISEDKPILVSIGYAACHWCHVMERESFEQESVARLMNESFISIKVDREERPDLDHIYMDALQAMAGSGGWPLNVFLTPDGRPFFGGTYFPPVRAYGRLSWTETLQEVVKVFRERRSEVEAQADRLTEHLSVSNVLGPGVVGSPVGRDHLDALYSALMEQADHQEGGFGNPPKFPQTFSIQWLIRHAHFTGAADGLAHALTSLDKMLRGGIYDQLGGGSARYSTDREWLVPHFEKMLYDNALMVSVLCEAYASTRSPRFRSAIADILDFALREWKTPEGGFCSAWDADSEGVEGKFYTWTLDEIKGLLGADAELFCKMYGVSAGGNWEGVNILHAVITPGEVPDVSREEFLRVKERGRQVLLEARAGRVPPLLDDKQLLGWNALMNKAFSQAYAVTGEDKYREIAVGHMAYMLHAFRAKDGLGHVYKGGVLRYPAFLDDYAYLIQALLFLQEVTANPDYLIEARNWMEYAIAQFGDPSSGYFCYTPSGQKDILFRKKEVYDGATPSGNAVMAWNLWYLSIMLDQPGWRSRALGMLQGVLSTTIRYPTSFGVWADLALYAHFGWNEIAVVGPNYWLTLKDVVGKYIPNKVLQSGLEEDPRFPLMEGKKDSGGATWIYLCRNYSCGVPVGTTDALMQQIHHYAQ